MRSTVNIREAKAQLSALISRAGAGEEIVIAVKQSLGKLELAEPPRTFIENRIRNNALTPFPTTMAHAVRVADLPCHHRDPFDRLLIAQGLEEKVPLLSADEIRNPLTRTHAS